ncbi:HesB/YadR/YfhF family protein [Halobacillus yeomjeoni]|uniref:HesB/YadR/YfhF family protein n=1 Tax=Halobacillus yeomjeoni TaxID=311194 RepID=A0A931HU27_9BACI|nr:HesB/YadR/YfhF family protein [Halobacillus yeomjeoni]MBH0229428.1 HesB/YadR/YfhF family protein [Halobacillus yeomjeoni]MCA0983164.1 HesB/YadR/YfhF family protein [Halobacillus yeomjeoni]
MDLTVTEQAAQWYEEELEINKETHLRFYVRYGGVGGLQPGFSLAIKLEEPAEPVAQTTVGKITFFVEEDDEWYFDNHSLKVEFDEKWKEPAFNYNE